jgi:hypothetical protein
MTPPTIRRAPVDLPGPEGDNSIAREPLWYAYGAGEDEPRPPAWTWSRTPPPEDHPQPPAPIDGAGSTLPLGTVDILEATSYPEGRADGDILRALITAFGLQRHEPDNPFKSHRAYASPRCLFPVSVFVERRGRWHLLDPNRHALVEAAPATATGQILLTGRYTAIPAAYKWFRGSLVNLELGIAMRALTVALDLFGVPASLRLPGPASHSLLTELSLATTWEWSLPLVIDTVAVTRPTKPAAPPTDHRTIPDDVVADLVEANRAQNFDPAPAPLNTAIPSDAEPGVPNWAELLWRRDSGRMPRGLHGMAGVRRHLSASALTDALRWCSVPPPGADLRTAWDLVTVTVAVQDVDGYVDGVHHIENGLSVTHQQDPAVMARLEQVYGYPIAPDNGCDLRHASMVWFFSVRPRALTDRLDGNGWSAAQYACGWAAHGLCLSAAATGLFARPVRAFKEIPTQQILGLEPDEMIMLSVVAGTRRHAGGPLLDLRL